MSAPNFVDLVGKRFGKRVVIARAETPIYRGKRGSSRWVLQCDCGNISTVQTSGVKSTTHCGCENQEAAIRSGKTRRSTIPTGIRERKSYEEVSFPKHLMKKYGLSIEHYKAMLDSQQGLCAITGLPPEDGEKLQVDHDHETKKVRGLLRKEINKALGMFQDKPEWLIAAAMYLTAARSK